MYGFSGFSISTFIALPRHLICLSVTHLTVQVAMVLSYEVTPNMLLKDPTLLLHEKDFDGRTYLRFP